MFRPVRDGFRPVLDGYSGAFNYRGRVRRQAYGVFVVFHTLLSYFVLSPLLQWGGKMLHLHGLPDATPSTLDFLALIVFTLVLDLPIISILVRRFHDGNTSGWYVLFPGLLWLCPLAVVAAFIAPVPRGGGANRFGPDPRFPDIDQNQPGETSLQIAPGNDVH